MKYWNYPHYGGPLIKNMFTHKDTLKAFVEMEIDLKNGGGIYNLPGVYGNRNYFILFSGSGGNVEMRQTIQQLFKQEQWDELEDEYIDKLLIKDGCYR